MHTELAQDVLDVRPGGLRADDQRLGDGLRSRTACQQAQHIPLPACKSGDTLEDLVLFVPAPHQASKEVPEHLGRDLGFATMHGTRDFE